LRFCSRVRPRLERDVALVRIDEWVLAARVQADVRHFESRGVGSLVRHLIQTNLLKLWRRDRSLCQSSVSTLSSFLVNPRRGISACVWVGTGDVFVVASFPIRLVVEAQVKERENTRPAKEKKSLDWLEGLLFALHEGSGMTEGPRGATVVCVYPVRRMEGTHFKQANDYKRTL
jgi:hypothetical protein